VEPKGEFHPKPQWILDRKEKMLQNRAIVQVKVKWKKFGENEATWELEDAMRRNTHFCLMYKNIYMAF